MESDNLKPAWGVRVYEYKANMCLESVTETCAWRARTLNPPGEGEYGKFEYP